MKIPLLAVVLSAFMVLSVLACFTLASNFGFLTYSSSDFGEERVVSKAVVVEIAPPWDTIDSGAAECFLDAVKYAESAGAMLLYKVNSYGGYLDAAFAMGDAVYYSHVPAVAYVENKALSAGTLIILPADIIALQRGSIIGAMKPIMVNPVTGEVTFVNESKILEPIIGKAKVYSEPRRRNVTLIMDFIVNAKVVDSSTATSLGVGDFEVANFEELISRLNGLVIEKRGVRYRLEVPEGFIEGYTCSVRSRFLSLLSNAYLANALLSVGVLAAIFALASGRLVVLPLAVALILLGLVGTGVNPNLVSVFFMLLGAILLAVELFILPGFGVVGISGIVLITLGFALLPMYIPTGVVPQGEYLMALRAFIFGMATTLGTFLGIVLFKVIQVKRKKPILYTPEGKEGIVVEDIKPGKVGFVKIEGEYWRATSSKEINAGERVVVVSMKSDGVLVVEKKTME